MKTITIELTDTEYKGIEYAAVSPQEWADNAVTNRARIAMTEIVGIYTTKALDEGVAIPATRELIVADAYARGWVVALADVPISSPSS
jgi:hypothetical protein